MKTIKTLVFLAVLAASAAYAQLNTIVQTSLSAAVTATDTIFPVASATGMVAPTTSVAGSALYIVDLGQTMGELVSVTAISSTNISVRRTGGGKAKAHASGAMVLVATAPNWFIDTDPSGSCVTATTYASPRYNVSNGQRWMCDATTLTWVRNDDYVFYVPPTQCTTAPTTSTVTNTYPQIGASNVFVLNATTNAAAGTTTLVCNILIPTRVSATRGAQLKDIVVAVGSQTTAPTSIGTATMGTISFPTPVATTQTASVVTPVSAGGTLVQVGPTTTVLTVTTAGAFLTFKYSVATATPVNLSTDLQILQFTVPYLQSAAAAMTLNFPGLWVHYTAPAL